MTASDLVELAGREAIAPCPFCGGEAQALDFKGTKFKPAVSCTVCPADMPARTMAEAITAWNRRAALRESFGAWTDIPTAKRFGRTLTSDAVEHLKAGTLLRFYSPDPWFEPGEHMPSCGEIVVFTGKVNNDYPRIGPHLEVSTIDGDVYPGGGWVYRLFQFVGEAASALRERIPLPGVEGRVEGSSRDHDHTAGIALEGSWPVAEYVEELANVLWQMARGDFSRSWSTNFRNEIRSAPNIITIAGNQLAKLAAVARSSAKQVVGESSRDEHSILPLSSSRGEAEQK